MMNNEVVGRPSALSNDLIRNIADKLVEDAATQFQNFRLNFHKFHAVS
jgi:hypothetical protein